MVGCGRAPPPPPPAPRVPGVKVVVVDQVGGQHVLENDGEVVLAVQPELQLLLRHTGQQRARLEADVVEEPRAEPYPRAAFVDLGAHLLLGSLGEDALAQEAQATKGQDPTEEVVRGPARRARVLERLDLVYVGVPEVRRRVAHERAEAGVASLEQRDVVFREDFPELVVRQAADRGDLVACGGTWGEGGGRSGRVQGCWRWKAKGGGRVLGEGAGCRVQGQEAGGTRQEAGGRRWRKSSTL